MGRAGVGCVGRSFRCEALEHMKSRWRRLAAWWGGLRYTALAALYCPDGLLVAEPAVSGGGASLVVASSIPI